MMFGYFRLGSFNCQLSNPAVQDIRARTCTHFSHASFFCQGVGKGDGSDLKVKIILKKQQVFQCVCAKQENCSVRFLHEHARRATAALNLKAI